MTCPKCGADIGNAKNFCPLCGHLIHAEPDTKTMTLLPVFPETPTTVSQKIRSFWPDWQTEDTPIGRGSFGAVYKAVRRDNNIESYAAIKIISIPSDSSEVDSVRSEGLGPDGTRLFFKKIVDSFVGEIQLMESLKGIQNIVSVEDYKVIEKTDTIGWDIFIRMELLTPFNTYLCGNALSEADVIKLGIDICTALEICSQSNIIHRDIKPENIFVNKFGYFKLGDFGIARKLENLTDGLSQKGTHNYMAPEVASSNHYDARADIYSLGIVLYRLLNNNRLPFLTTDQQLLNPLERTKATERRLRGEPLPAPCNASPAMANLVLRACAFDPRMRFRSATEMKHALNRLTDYHASFANRAIPSAPASVPFIAAPVATPSVRTPVASPSVKPPVASPSVKPPVASPSVKPPVASPSVKPPVASPSVKPPVASPSVKPPVASPSVKPPVASPSVKPPVASPSIKPSVASPSVKPPVATPPVKPPVATPPVKPPATNKSNSDKTKVKVAAVILVSMIILLIILLGVFGKNLFKKPVYTPSYSWYSSSYLSSVFYDGT